VVTAITLMMKAITSVIIVITPVFFQQIHTKTNVPQILLNYSIMENLVGILINEELKVKN
jgi:hypothetical protein